MAELSKAARDFFAKAGQKGGSVKGQSKRRGDAEFYRKIGSKGGKAPRNQPKEDLK